MTRFADTELEVSNAPTISKKQRDLSTNSNAVLSTVEEIDLSSTNNIKTHSETEEEEERLLR